MKDELTMGREIKAIELARILGFGGSKEVKRQKAIRWLKLTGVGMQHAPGSYWFTTYAKLRECATAEHVRQEQVRRVMGLVGE